MLTSNFTFVNFDIVKTPLIEIDAFSINILCKFELVILKIKPGVIN